MTVQERKAEIDRKVEPCLAWRVEEQARLYQLFYLEGHRIEGIGEKIDRAIREQCKE